MSDPRIRLKDPFLAAFLAFLVPGLGHLYQGRHFKAAVYGVCIWGMFLTGMSMAEWKAMQSLKLPDLPRRGLNSLKFAAQMPVGLPAIVGIVQAHRLNHADNKHTSSLAGPISATFQGTADFRDKLGQQQGQFLGTLSGKPSVNEFNSSVVEGTFQGTFEGEAVQWKLSNYIDLAPAIGADSQREVTARIVRDGTTDEVIGNMRGSVSRSLWNWLCCPLNPAEEKALHLKLGKFHELAMVFTWIAGLLNVLAIFDAFEGPAYGYGDEEAASAIASGGEPPANAASGTSHLVPM